MKIRQNLSRQECTGRVLEDWSAKNSKTRRSAPRIWVNSGSIRNWSSICKAEYNYIWMNSPTLNILILSLPVCSAHNSSWSFPALPRSPNIKTHWRLLLSTLSVVFYVFPVWNHTSRSFICTWPWNTASIFFSLTLPLQRFLGAHVKRLSADIYLRHLRVRRYLRGPRLSCCVEGVPASQTLLLSLLSWQQPNRMQRCCLLLSQPILFFFSSYLSSYYLTHFGGTLGHSDRAAAIRGSVQGILIGWDMIKCPGAECWCCCLFSARSSSAETDRFFVQRVTWGTD